MVRTKPKPIQPDLLSNHAQDTLTFLAFCEKRELLINKHGICTDGYKLYDRFSVLAVWVDPTRIVVSSDRVSRGGPDIAGLKRFLAYWCGYYHIGVSEGEV